MNLTIMSILLFLALFGVFFTAANYLIVAPAARRRMQQRLAAIRQTGGGAAQDLETRLFLEKTLENASLLEKWLSALPAANRIRLFLDQAGTDKSPATFLSLSLVLGLSGYLAGILLHFPALLSLILFGLAASIPFVYLAFQRHRRLARFEELFPDAMDTLARAVRAGYAFTTALELIADEMPEPVSKEFRITFEQQNLGLPLRDALGNLTARVPLPDVLIFVTTLQIQRESGGNLAEILDNLSRVIRERFKLLRQVRVYTAQGKLSLYVLMALPPIAVVLFTLANPEYMSRLFTDPLGHRMIAAAVLLQLTGYLVIRRIVRLKV